MTKGYYTEKLLYMCLLHHNEFCISSATTKKNVVSWIVLVVNFVLFLFVFTFRKVPAFCLFLGSTHNKRCL